MATSQSASQAPAKVVRENYLCLVGGEMVGALSGRTFSTFNPATGEKLAEVPDCDAGDVDRAVQAAHAAFPAWKRIAAAERAALCRRLAVRLRARTDTYALLDALDGGNPVSMLRRDVRTAAGVLDYFAGLAPEIKGETIPAGADSFHFTVREPFGVVARITPFNHPLMFAARIAAPLIAGNTVVLKPAEQTPLSALEMAQDLKDIFPPGVVNVITGDGRNAGAPLVEHPLVRRIAFTGSVEVGREILRAAAEGIKTVTLELGGKNPLIVLPDVDLDKAAAAAFEGMNYTWTQGQSCGSTSRLFVHADIHDELVGRLVERVRRVRLGLPQEDSTEMGCLASQKQFDKVLSYIELGKKEGARVLSGGGRSAQPELQRGYFIEPTVFDRVESGMRLAQEEIFGPVQSVLKWRDQRELVEMVNSVLYGLTAGIWTRDFSTAYRLASEIEAGYIWINDTSRHFPGVPFGGFKQSGLGREESLSDLLSYTQIKSINVNLK